jgi:hypothetical protein
MGCSSPPRGRSHLNVNTDTLNRTLQEADIAGDRKIESNIAQNPDNANSSSELIV